MDDGSNDSSPMICERYSATDSRFRTIHKTNGGVSSARNAGIDLAKGEYLMFVDSDDALLPNALSAMTEGLNGEDMVLGGYITFIDSMPRNEIFPHHSRSWAGNEMNDFFESNIRHNCEMLDAPWAKLFRRKALGGLRFNENLSYAEDKLFVFSFMASSESVRTCSELVYGYHLRPGSLGSDLYSDRHIMQLRRFLPAYKDVLGQLSARYPDAMRLNRLYHEDLVGRYICRILNIFLTRRTSLLSEQFLGELYAMMDADRRLGLFSVRPGQILNIFVYRICSISVASMFYRTVASLVSLFRRR